VSTVAPVVTLLRRAFSEEEAGSVTSWCYPPPFDLYNLPPHGHELLLARSADGEGYYPALGQDGTVVAFAVFGAEARVLGQKAVNGTLDFGLGVRPGLTSQGLGSNLLVQAVALGQALFSPQSIRAAVAKFNTRSLNLCRNYGFHSGHDFTGPDGRPFTELLLPLHYGTTAGARIELR
jgi:[ribosomal protein S18]-alanine N-acetyltransferase